jgi:hypothetical protein
MTSLGSGLARNRIAINTIANPTIKDMIAIVSPWSSQKSCNFLIITNLLEGQQRNGHSIASRDEHPFAKGRQKMRYAKRNDNASSSVSNGASKAHCQRERSVRTLGLLVENFCCLQKQENIGRSDRRVTLTKVRKDFLRSAVVAKHAANTLNVAVESILNFHVFHSG